jgi:integrase
MANIKLKKMTPAMLSLLLMELTISFIGYRAKREEVKCMQVYGNGSVVKKGKDKFLLRVVVGYDALDKPIRKSKTVNTSSKREAERLLHDWIKELEAQAAQPEEGTPTGDMLLTDCIKDYLEFKEDSGYIRPRTADGYDMLIRYPERLLPGKTIGELTHYDMEQFYRALKDHGGKDGASLGANTVLKVNSFINAAFKRAVANGWIPANPNDGACPYKGVKPTKAIMSEEEISRFIARVLAYPRKDQATALLISACCGLRRGETCALTWRQVDFENKCLIVEQAATQISTKRADSKANGNTFWLDDPKSANGNRRVPMVDLLVDYLKQEKAAQRERLTYFNYYKGDDTPVCANQHGGYMLPSNMSKFSKTFLIDNGFDPGLSLHSLRHSFVTHLADHGYPPNQIGQISGQSPMVVMNTYANHRSESVIQQMTGTLNQILTPETVS